MKILNKFHLFCIESIPIGSYVEEILAQFFALLLLAVVTYAKIQKLTEKINLCIVSFVSSTEKG